MTISASQIAGALKAKRTGPGRWTATCPAHDDKHPSLSITEAKDGTTLLYCFAGCPQDAVIAALRDLGLWHERRDTITPTPYEPPMPTAPPYEWQLRELEQLLSAVEGFDEEAHFVQVCAVLEGAAQVSYYTLWRISNVLRSVSCAVAFHVDRWHYQRGVTALHEARA